MLSITPYAFGQSAASMTLSQLNERTAELVDAGDYIVARPYLEELVKRFEDAEENQRQRLEAIFFYLGVSYLVEYSDSPSNELLNSGIKWFQRQLEDFPDGSFAINGNLAMADAYRGLQQWDKATTVYLRLLQPPLSLRLSTKQRIESLRKLSQAYYIAKNWQEGIPWFKKLLDESRDLDDQAAAAAALMEAYIDQGQFPEAIDLFPFLVGESPARYKLQFNVALLEAGDKLAKEKAYGQAMLMYRMVLTVEEIIRFQDARLRDLKSQYSLLTSISTGDTEQSIELETEIFNTEAQLKALREMNSYTPDLRVRIARNYLLTGRDWESFWAYLELIKDYPNSPDIQDYYYAAFTGAANIGLTDEVIKLGETYASHPEWKSYNKDVTLRMAQFYIEKGRINDFFTLADNFIQQNPDDPYCSQVVFLMGSTYVNEQDFIGMIDRFKQYIKAYPKAIMQDGLNYWTGMGYVFLQDYGSALDYFDTVLSKHPGSVYTEDSLYRRGICLFGIQDLDAAREAFQSFISRYPRSNLRGEVEYFLGELEASIPNVAEALEHYRNVEKFTDNIGFVQNAYFRGAELLETNQRYDEMAELLERFIRDYEKQGDISLAMYQLGRARELQNRPAESLQIYWDTIQRFGNDPQSSGLDLAIEAYPESYYTNLEVINANLDFLEMVKRDAAFRALIAEDRSALFNHLREHPEISEDVKRPFYDRAYRVKLIDNTAPLESVLKKYRSLQSKMPTQTPEEKFRQGYEEAMANEERTLALRLQMQLEKMGIVLNPGQVFTEEDFSNGSPATLIWMGRKNSDFDPQLARQAFQDLLSRFPDSPFVLQALLELGNLEAEAGNYEEALGHYQQAEARFPGEPEIVDAVLAQGDVYRKMQRFAEARDQYNLVVSNRQWRGEPHAEALFKTGVSYLEQNELEKAQTFFERTYIGHAAFTDWSGAAYLESGKLLQQLGRTDEAVNTYDEFLNEPGFADSKHYEAIRQARSAL